MVFFTLRVVEVRRETVDTVTIAFKQPGLKKIKYSSGQYLTLTFRINGRRYIRPYSFSSAPNVDAYLEVTVKRVPGGTVSNYIVDTLKVDDIVEVMPPMGDFVLKRDELAENAHIVLWGAGSGVTPLMSIAKDVLKQNIADHVTLVYGNRTTESVIFGDKIEQLKERYNQKFTAWHFYSQLAIAPDNPAVVQGRIDPARVLKVMATEGALNNTVHFICGPPGLKESVKDSLKLLGVADSKVFSEDFEVTRNPADFEDIITRKVNITLDGKQIKAEVIKGKSILEAGLDAGLDMPYSCQTGNCLICKGRLINGKIKMIGVDKIPDGLKQGEYLLCSSFPLTDDVIIEID